MKGPLWGDEKTGNETQAQDYLADRALIIAANRGPVTFETCEDGRLESQPVPAVRRRVDRLRPHKRGRGVGIGDRGDDGGM